MSFRAIKLTHFKQIQTYKLLLAMKCKLKTNKNQSRSKRQQTLLHDALHHHFLWSDPITFIMTFEQIQFYSMTVHLSNDSAIGQMAAAIFSLRLNFLAINSLTSSTPTKLSKNGINKRSSRSDRSSNQLSIGMPLST